MSNPKTIEAWASPEPGSKLIPVEKPIPALENHEVLIEVQSCGICHSDIHLIDNDWKISRYPLVPGHEIVGKVVSTGSSRSRLKVGQFVGVGWQKSSCNQCELCLTGRDNMCFKKLATCVAGWGGYANYHVADERYAFEIPENLVNPATAPLLCGGITVFSPMCEFLNLQRSGIPRVGVVGLGGLGHLAVKLAAAAGYEVTVFSSSPKKEAESKEMGAHHFVNSTLAKTIEEVGPRLDLIIVTVNVDLPWESYLETLRGDGTLCFVGVPPSKLNIGVDSLLDRRRRIAGSPIGSRSRIYQMLDFCNTHKIGSTIERFEFDQVNTALQHVRENKARYRAVLSRAGI